MFFNTDEANVKRPIEITGEKSNIPSLRLNLEKRFKYGSHRLQRILPGFVYKRPGIQDKKHLTMQRR